MTDKIHNIIDIKSERKRRGMESHDVQYQRFINDLSKIELLEEMVRYQEERSQTEHLNLSLIVRGKILFSALEFQAETEELRLLASSYRRHLEHEMTEMQKAH